MPGLGATPDSNEAHFAIISHAATHKRAWPLWTIAVMAKLVRSPVQPVFQPQHDGILMINPTPMHNLTTVPIPGFAPEDTLIGPDNGLYTGLRNNGTIIRIELDTHTVSEVGKPGGMPLGLEWLPDGRLLICNAALGLQRLDTKTGAVEAICAHGLKFGVCNNAAVTADGTIFVSDSSTRYGLDKFRRDIIEDTRSGRLIRIDPDGHASILLEGLSFANGVAVLPDGDRVLVAETAKNQIHAVSIDTGTSEVFAATPGLPDNICVGSDGLVWVALPSRPNPALARLHAAPLFIRKLIASVPDSLQPNTKPCARVVAYQPDGKMVHYFEGDTTLYDQVTGVREHQGRVYLGSIEQDCVAWFDINPKAARLQMESARRFKSLF